MKCLFCLTKSTPLLVEKRRGDRCPGKSLSVLQEGKAKQMQNITNFTVHINPRFVGIFVFVPFLINYFILVSVSIFVVAAITVFFSFLPVYVLCYFSLFLHLYSSAWGDKDDLVAFFSLSYPTLHTIK